MLGLLLFFLVHGVGLSRGLGLLLIRKVMLQLFAGNAKIFVRNV